MAVKAPLDGRVAIVTGASRGIGRAIAYRLAADGAACVLAARDGAALDAVGGAIVAAGGQALVQACDLREPTAQRDVVAGAVRAFGRLDIVVNNAGATRRAPFAELSDADWADGFALKFFGAMRLCREAWPHLAARQGSIVNIAGVGGRTPGADFALGGSVNAAVLALTKSLADAALAAGIQVNAVNPGAIRTDRLRKRLDDLAAREGIAPAEAESRFRHAERVTRVGEPEDVAALVAFILGPEGRFFHGALVDLDGGATKAI